MTYKIPAVSVISNQFPEFIKEDYPRFVRFVELYYEYVKKYELEGIGESFTTIRDIDVTLEKFIDSLWKEFGINVPRTNIANDTHFLKHIKDFCSTKGSEESFRILFRHLFNTEIDIKYPQDYMFRTSDGEWVQDVSFLVSVSSGNIYDIVGQQVNIHTSLQTIQLNVLKIKKTDGFYEVFIERTLYDTISYGDLLTFNGVVATIEKTISNIEITKPGIGFSVGRLFSINSTLGSGAKIKVTSIGDSITISNIINFIGIGTTTVTGTVDSTNDYAVGDILYISGAVGTEQSKLNGTWAITSIASGLTFTFVVSSPVTGTLTTALGKTTKKSAGTLLKLDIINFGSGFDHEFFASITSASTDSRENEFPASLTVVSGGIDYTGTLRDQTAGFTDNGFISTDVYFEYDIVNPSYSGVILREFYTDSTVRDKTVWADANIAILDVKIGTIRKYPGYYKSDRGFISNAYKLQDSFYYQLYSYVISCKESFNTYKDIVKSLVHPTGLQLFGEQRLTNEISLVATLEILNRYVQVSAQDEFFSTDSARYLFNKLLSDTFTYSELKTFVLNKPVSEVISMLTVPDVTTLGVGKSVSEVISMLTVPDTQTISSTKYLTDSVSMLTYLYWVADYENSTYTTSETPAVINKVASTYNIALTN